MAAADAAGVDAAVVKADVRSLIAASRGGGEFVERMLGRQLAHENKNGCTSAPSHNCTPAETDAGQHYPEHCFEGYRIGN